MLKRWKQRAATATLYFGCYIDGTRTELLSSKVEKGKENNDQESLMFL
jgi:hypothetical protein